MLINELQCPICNKKLYHNLEMNTLRCHLNHWWNINNEVPNLVPPDLHKLVIDTIKSFEFKWKYNPERTMEERNRIATTWYYDRFFNGINDEQGMHNFLKNKKRILDVGCGLGNMTHIFAKYASKAVVYGIDLTTVVQEVYERYGHYSNLQLIQGDFIRLPIIGKFDFINADGVLHHTPNTRESFLSLAKRLEIDGDFFSYIYRIKSPIREFTDNWLRNHTVNMTPEECMIFCQSLTKLGKQLRQCKLNIHFDEDIPLLGIKAGNIDLQRLIYWHMLKCFWDDKENTIASDLENFDWYHPLYAYRHTPEEVEQWCKDADLKIIQLRVGDSGISTWCKKKEK